MAVPFGGVKLSGFAVATSARARGVHLPQDDLDPICLRKPRCPAPTDRRYGTLSSRCDRLRYAAEVTARAPFVEAVFAAGGEPVVVHPYAPDFEIDVDAARERIWFADGVLLPGGGGCRARWSGQQPHPTEYGVDEEQDAFDLAVARVALADHLPLLAICRGTQIVNVALGGDLVQDMDDTVGNHRNRVHDLDVDETSHWVRSSDAGPPSRATTTNASPRGSRSESSGVLG